MHHHSTDARACERVLRLCTRVCTLPQRTHRVSQAAQRRCALRAPVPGVYDKARHHRHTALRQRLEGLLLLLEAQLLLSSGSPGAEHASRG